MPISDLITPILATLASLGITGAVAAGVAYWLFKMLAKGWLDSKFQKDLEDFKAANLREVERLKAELSRYADRATKFHVREYEVLPEAWGLMNKAYGACHQAVAGFQQLADLDRMSKSQLEAWLKESDLKDFQKDEIRDSTHKIDKYGEFLTWQQLGKAQYSVSEFQNYVILQGVFIEEELVNKMIEAGTAMSKSLISRRMAEVTKNFQTQNQTDFWIQAYETLEPVGNWVQDIKENIRSRLSDIKAPL
ncbi:hypothetical protein [Caulobacter sp. SSI4214]|uniref:hypothetical protein n=1 Tax=Caulobacter sp. SSI4214 TaxID=2575739 RepID=UPI00143A9414|nr:hypothetical protein [Caulobacter sp. SSI4214]